MAPYEVVCGPKPLLVTSYSVATFEVHVVDNTLHNK
jgi:hypothetical protein